MHTSILHDASRSLSTADPAPVFNNYFAAVQLHYVAILTTVSATHKLIIHNISVIT